MGMSESRSERTLCIERRAEDRYQACTKRGHIVKSHAGLMSLQAERGEIFI